MTKDPFECAKSICEILDEYDLTDSENLGVIISAIYYILPSLNMTPEFIGKETERLLNWWIEKDKKE